MTFIDYLKNLAFQFNKHKERFQNSPIAPMTDDDFEKDKNNPNSLLNKIMNVVAAMNHYWDDFYERVAKETHLSKTSVMAALPKDEKSLWDKLRDVVEKVDASLAVKVSTVVAKFENALSHFSLSMSKHQSLVFERQQVQQQIDVLEAERDETQNQLHEQVARLCQRYEIAVPPLGCDQHTRLQEAVLESAQEQHAGKAYDLFMRLTPTSRASVEEAAKEHFKDELSDGCSFQSLLRSSQHTHVRGAFMFLHGLAQAQATGVPEQVFDHESVAAIFSQFSRGQIGFNLMKCQMALGKLTGRANDLDQQIETSHKELTSHAQELLDTHSAFAKITGLEVINTNVENLLMQAHQTALPTPTPSSSST